MEKQKIFPATPTIYANWKQAFTQKRVKSVMLFNKISNRLYSIMKATYLLDLQTSKENAC